MEGKNDGRSGQRPKLPRQKRYLGYIVLGPERVKRKREKERWAERGWLAYLWETRGRSLG